MKNKEWPTRSYGYDWFMYVFFNRCPLCKIRAEHKPDCEWQKAEQNLLRKGITYE